MRAGRPARSLPHLVAMNRNLAHPNGRTRWTGCPAHRGPPCEVSAPERDIRALEDPVQALLDQVARHRSEVAGLDDAGRIDEVMRRRAPHVVCADDAAGRVDGD